jgi:2-dehydropantoate 2-reductase
MKYVIYGAGAIGGVIGACLYRSGFDVTLIARGDHLKRIQSDGLRLVSADGVEVFDIPTVGHPNEITWSDTYSIILTMKAQDTADAINTLQGLVPRSIPIVSGQNGVANEITASRWFDNVYAMLLLIPATFLNAGEVIHHVSRKSGVLGVLDTGRYPFGSDDYVDTLCGDLTASGFSATPDVEIMKLKYAKLITNLNNAVGAICGFESDTKHIYSLLTDEALNILNKAAIQFDRERETQKYTLLGRAEVSGAPRGGSSSWQSVMRGGQIEVDFLNGEIVLIAKKMGLDAPANSLVQELAQKTIQDSLKPGWISPQEILKILD